MLPWQKLARDDKHRFKVLVAGRKARKTTFMVNRLLKAAAIDARGLTYPYVAPFRKQAKEIVWDDHVGRALNLFNQYGIRYKVNHSDLTIRFEDSGSKFQVDGADNAEALRGKSDWGGIGMDEYATWKPHIWREIIRPNLQVHKAWGIFGGTPKGYGNELYRVAKLGDHNHVIDDKPAPLDPDFQTFHATSYDNIYLPEGETEAAKRDNSAEFFAQEYLAQFTRFTGLVYPEFDLAMHVHYFDREFGAHGDYYFGVDFAVRGWNAAITLRVDSSGDMWIMDAYKSEGETAAVHAEKIKEMITRYNSLEKYVGYGDPAGWANNLGWVTTQTRNPKEPHLQWAIADEFIDAGLPITPANNKVVAGINYVKQLFRANKIHIHPSCTALVDELMQYQWKDQPATQKGEVDEPEKVRKINDHLVDAMRYALYSKPMPADEEEKPSATIFPGSFPPPRIEVPKQEDEYTPIEIPSLYD